ncbi:MAG: hypothetical protein ACJAY2_000233 [Pseudomonadales bacterium]|jgi:hypothetical protein
MDSWTIEQVLAVYDLCQSTSVTLIHRHEDQLLEQMIEIDQRSEVIPTPDSSCCNTNLELPLDD